MTDEEKRMREIALSHATRIAAEQQVQKYDGDVIVNIAKRFLEFLKGDEN